MTKLSLKASFTIFPASSHHSLCSYRPRATTRKPLATLNQLFFNGPPTGVTVSDSGRIFLSTFLVGRQSRLYSC